MINKLSVFFTNKLLLSDTIEYEERELYIYGFFILFSQLLFLTVTLTVGIILNIIIESIIFFVAFSLIRKYAGGYHAKTEARCEVTSTLLIISSLCTIKILSSHPNISLLTIITALSAIFIFVFSPLDTPEKPLSKMEVKHFGRIARIILLIVSIMIILSYILCANFVFLPLCLSLVLENLLLSAGKLKNLIISH